MGSLEPSPNLSTQFYTEYDLEFGTILSTIVSAERENYIATYSAILRNIVGRKWKRDHNRYNRWRTALPFLGSLTHWLLSGNAMAKGNPHVQKWDHSASGANANKLTLGLTPGQSSALIESVRSLFTYTEVQRTDAGRYFKHMALLDGANNRTYLIQLKWYRRETEHDVAVEVRTFNGLPIATPDGVELITRQFRALGFSD